MYYLLFALKKALAQVQIEQERAAWLEYEVQKDLERRLALTPAQRVAEDLHEIFCQESVHGHCTFHDTDWIYPDRSEERKYYLELAERALLAWWGTEQSLREFLAVLYDGEAKKKE